MFNLGPSTGYPVFRAGYSDALIERITASATVFLSWRNVVTMKRYCT